MIFILGFIHFWTDSEWCYYLQMKRSASSWLHKFAIAAEKAVVDEFARQGLTTAEEKAEFGFLVMSTTCQSLTAPSDGSQRMRILMLRSSR